MGDIITGQKGDWEMVIGLEVHAQIISNSKLFSAASTAFGAAPNSQVSLVDAAFPGMLPVINRVCVEQAIRTGLGLQAEIHHRSVFDRKNYFYADLPQGYQISQFHYPIVGKGVIILDLPDGESRKVGVTRLHLEQDAGKSLHDQNPQKTYIDLNRSGVGLMEIVSEPDLRGAAEAAAYLRKLRSILRYLGTCDGNMEEGSMRCDVNISMRPVGQAEYGTRCEIKNVNSIKAVQAAIAYEATRQVQILEEGGKIIQETRLWDANKNMTRSMRGKEEAHDYRYFPDPDLPPLLITDEEIARIKADLPELPDAKKTRFMREYELNAYDADVLVAEQSRADYFETVLEGAKFPAKLAANWVVTELLGVLNKNDQDIAQSPISAPALAELLDLLHEGVISGRIAKDIFPEMFSSGVGARQIVAEKGLEQVSDVTTIDPVIDKILANNPEQLAQYQAGKDKLFGFFVGQVMQATKGKANPALVNQRLKEKLQQK